MLFLQKIEDDERRLAGHAWTAVDGRGSSELCIPGDGSEGAVLKKHAAAPAIDMGHPHGIHDVGFRRLGEVGHRVVVTKPGSVEGASNHAFARNDLDFLSILIDEQQQVGILFACAAHKLTGV